MKKEKLSLMVSAAMKIAIDREALESGLTQSEVCERRIRRSFEIEDWITKTTGRDIYGNILHGFGKYR